LIADLPGVDTFNGVALLPPGTWRGLRSAYQLKRASEAVKVEVRPGKAVRGTGLLDLESRVQLLAILVKHGVEPEQAARRLALVQTLPVADLAIEFSLDGVSSALRPSFHLEVVRTPRRLMAARLYYVPAAPINTATLGREIAALLEEADIAHTAALALRDADEVLADEAVSESELAEARRLLYSARRRARLPEDDEDEPPPDLHLDAAQGRPQPVAPPSDLAPTDGDTQGEDEADTQSSTSTDPKPIVDSERVKFGPPKAGPRRKPPRRERRAPRLTGTPGTNARGGPDKEVEDEAMRIVTRYGREILGAEVFDVHQEKKGWDLEFRLPDGAWEFVEVKGTSGDASFALTRNERRAAADHETGPRYTLYWVSNVADRRRAEIRKFPGIGLHLTEDTLDPLVWEAWDWSALPHQIVPLREKAAAKEDA
jgi:hypothetical protein